MIRKHIPSDLEPILEIWYQSSTLAHPFLEDNFVEQVKTAMRDMYIPGSETWVYEENNNILGFISMMDNEIGGLFVLPNHHGNGIGTQLVNFIKPMHKRLEVEVFDKNTIGRAFYDKYGFEQMNHYFHKDSNQDVLRLKLDNLK
ncbi:N-acetyltransferase [Hanstruepera ponticola]|uniref:N-acetyltransferase n=1 Tax=Hanstruepera ponticola TaxID=2042995 RepID=UPI0017863D0B|nr:N-acetyltransferase [Hanstruepera ponticola]